MENKNKRPNTTWDDSELKSEWNSYVRTNIAEMRMFREGEVLDVNISISQADKENGSPKLGDMIARNPKNYNDQWLVAYKYFKDNFCLAEQKSQDLADFLAWYKSTLNQFYECKNSYVVEEYFKTKK